MADKTQAEQKYVPECYACPIGTVSMAVQGTAPEATEHLIRAGREVLSAFRSMLEGLDAFLSMMEERSGATRRTATVQSIPVRRNK
jgi:amino acid permease